MRKVTIDYTDVTKTDSIVELRGVLRTNNESADFSMIQYKLKLTPRSGMSNLPLAFTDKYLVEKVKDVIEKKYLRLLTRDTFL